MPNENDMLSGQYNGKGNYTDSIGNAAAGNNSGQTEDSFKIQPLVN